MFGGWLAVAIGALTAGIGMAPHPGSGPPAARSGCPWYVADPPPEPYVPIELVCSAPVTASADDSETVQLTLGAPGENDVWVIACVCDPSVRVDGLAISEHTIDDRDFQVWEGRDGLSAVAVVRFVEHGETVIVKVRDADEPPDELALTIAAALRPATDAQSVAAYESMVDAWRAAPVASSHEFTDVGLTVTEHQAPTGGDAVVVLCVATPTAADCIQQGPWSPLLMLDPTRPDAAFGVVDVDGDRWLIGRTPPHADSDALTRLTLTSTDGRKPVTPLVSDDGHWAVHALGDADPATVELADGTMIQLRAADRTRARPGGTPS